MCLCVHSFKIASLPYKSWYGLCTFWVFNETVLLVSHQSGIISQRRGTYHYFLLLISVLQPFSFRNIMPKRFTKEAFAKLEAQITKKKQKDESSDEDSLPEINEEIICSICLEEVLTEYLRLPCRHCFHRRCIIEWKRKKPQCPNCRLV